MRWFTGIVDSCYDLGHVFVSLKKAVWALENCFSNKQQENILRPYSYVT